jgi:hypothetical protein
MRSQSGASHHRAPQGVLGHCQAQITRFSKALSKFHLRNWVPHPAAEVPDKYVGLSQMAALSRLRPLADGPDQWGLHGLSAVTDGPSSLGPEGMA